MTETVHIEKVNESRIRILADRGVLQEISDAFTFKVKGAEFQPAYKNRLWDGKIRLLDLRNSTTYTGLTKKVMKFCMDRDYQVTCDQALGDEEFSLVEARKFVDDLSLPESIQDRDYQVEAFAQAVRDGRNVLLSPTSSGKSLLIYLLMRYYDAKTLIVVPTVTLVHQLAGDFVSYGFGAGEDEEVHKIFTGQEKDTLSKVTITTWQSVYKLPKHWFSQFGLIIGDEAHLFAAKSLVKIMDSLPNCGHRFGLSGTLDGTQVHELTLEGLFGPIRKVITTKELMDQGYVAQLKIKCIVFNYGDFERKSVSKMEYSDEMDFLVGYAARNRFIKNLGMSLEGNTLILFQFVEKHGKILYDLMKDLDRKVFFIHGGVDGLERDEVRGIVEKEKDAIIIASYGTFSTGINIKNIHNLVLASPSKSRIRNLQSIGRALRMSETKSSATLYDLADDLSWKSRSNHTLKHFVERVKIYNEEGFEYKLYNVRLNP